MTKYSTGVIALLILFFIRFISNIALFVLSFDISSLIVAIIYFVALWGVYTVKKWGYIVAVGFSIVDIGFIAISGLSAAFNLGAVAVDLIILILAIVEYQKLKK